MKTPLFAALLLLALTPAFAQTATPAAVKAIDDKVQPANAKRIILAGDSMMNHSTGWGSGFCDSLAGEIECFNMAKNGRSSKSYRAEGWWARALALKPTWILICFGGNDTPGKGPDRETDPATTYYENMKNYVLDARAAGATPILVTSMPSRLYMDGKFYDPLAPYAAAARKVAKDTNTLLMDLNADSTVLLTRSTQEQADEFDHVIFNGSAGTHLDRTHLNDKGNTLFGRMAAQEFMAVVPALKNKINIPITPSATPSVTVAP